MGDGVVVSPVATSTVLWTLKSCKIKNARTRVLGCDSGNVEKSVAVGFANNATAILTPSGSVALLDKDAIDAKQTGKCIDSSVSSSFGSLRRIDSNHVLLANRSECGCRCSFPCLSLTCSVCMQV
jgi:hypothetical protein